MMLASLLAVGQTPMKLSTGFSKLLAYYLLVGCLLLWREALLRPLLEGLGRMEWHEG